MAEGDAAKDASAAPEGDVSGLPAPSLSLLVASLSAQAQVALGLHENPFTKKTAVDLPAARHAVGMLEMIEAKTRGNADEDEARLLSGVLYALRMAYVEAAKKAR